MNSGRTSILQVYPETSLDFVGANGKGEILRGSNGPSVQISSDIGEVSIVKIEEKVGSTIVVANSTNILVTDIIIDGVCYYFKTPIVNNFESAIDAKTKNTILTHLDNNFIYTQTDDPIEIITTSGEIKLVKPVEVFLNSAFKLSNKYYIDSKTYSVKKYYNNLKIIFNAINLKITTGDKLIRIRNHSNIIHVDSFFTMSNSLIISNLSLLTTDPLGLRYSCDTIDMVNMIESASVGPFILPKNIIQIRENIVMIEVFVDSNEVKTKQYDINGDILFSDSNLASPDLRLKIRNSSDIMFAVVDKKTKIINKRYCGSKRANSQHSSLSTLYENQTMINGTRQDDNIVQFNIALDSSRLTISDISVVDIAGNAIPSIIVDDTIFAKGSVEMGVKYKDRLPGIFI
jgi:hypothetical protein